MNANMLGYWDKKKIKIKQKYKFISDTDLLMRERKEKELLEIMGHKLGKTKEEMTTLIESL